MYDVVKAEYKEDGISFWCWHDKKEKSINKKIDALVSQNLMDHPQNKDTRKRLNNYLKVNYLVHYNIWDPYSRNGTISSNIDPVITYKTVEIAPPFPPPKWS
jgi:hypothetical protein